MTTAPVFSLADLEALDDGATRAGNERRFLCPLCGDGKRRDAAHRCFCANVETGAWNCKRCKATGKLTDNWRERPKLKPLDLARHKRRQLSTLPDETPQAAPESANDWREQLHGAQAIDGTQSETYLRGRGVSIEAAKAAGVMFASNFYGKPAAIFPICDRHGAQTGASGRYMSTHVAPKTRIAGTKRNGVFATPHAFDGKSGAPIIVTEAPIDALSLATAGYPAVALCGTSGPAWMHLACGLRRVLLAFDADEAGDNAAAALAAFLAPYGARCERLRPHKGKDWNEVLQSDDAHVLADWLAVRVLLDKRKRYEYSILDD